MPDNNIKANINVNMQSNVNEEVDKIEKEYNSIKDIIESSLTKPMEVSEKTVESIGNRIKSLGNALDSLDEKSLDAWFEKLVAIQGIYEKLREQVAFNNKNGLGVDARNNPLKRQQEILDSINNFKETLAETKYQINSYKLDPQNFDTSSITKNIDLLKNSLNELEVIISKEQYYKFKTNIDNLTNSFNKQAQAVEEVKEKEKEIAETNEFENLEGSMLKSLNKLESTINKALNNPLNVSESKLEKINNEINTFSDSLDSSLKGIGKYISFNEFFELSDTLSIYKKKLDLIIDTKDDFNNFKDTLAETNHLINSYKSDPKNFDTSSITKNIDLLKNGLNELESVMSKEQYYKFKSDIDNLTNSFEKQAQAVKKGRQEILDAIANGGGKRLLSGFNNDSSLLDDQKQLSKEIEDGLDKIKNELDKISSDSVHINTSDAIQELRELEQSLINTKQVLETQLANGDIDFKSYAEGVKQVNELYDQLRKVATDNGFVKAQEDVSGFNEELKNAESIASNVNIETSESFEQAGDIVDQAKDKVSEFNEQVDNTGEQSDSSGKLFSKFGEITGAAGTKIAEFGSKLFTVGAIVKGVKAGFELFEDTLKDIGEAAISAGQTIGDGFEFAVDTIGNMIDLLGEASDKIRELADEGVELNQKYFVLSRTLGTDNARSANGVLSKIASLYGMNPDNLIDGFNNINLILSKMGANVEDVSGAFTKMVLDLSAAFGEDPNAVASKLQSAITMGYLGHNSIIARTLLKNDAERKAFKELNNEVERAQFLFDRAGRANGAMANWMNTAAGKVDQMNQSFSSLNGNVQRLAVGIMSKLAPVIIAVTNSVNRLVLALAKLLNIDMEGFDQNYEGISYDSSGLSDNLDDVSDSIDKVSDSANKAKKNLASFDDVIQINDNSGLSDVGDLADNLDDLSGLNETLDLSDFNLDVEESNEELSNFEKHLQKVAEYIEQGKWEDAGKELNTALKEVLEGIHWDDIKKKAAELGKGFAEFINGLFEDEQLGYDIGKFLVEIINTAFTFLYNYLKKTDFTQIGKFLGQTIIGFFENMDSDLIGKTIAEAFNKAIDFVKGFVDDMFEHKVFKDVPKDIDTGWELVGYKISDIINKAFADLDAEEAADTLIKFIDGVFTTLGTLIEKLDTETIKEKFRKFIHKVFEGFKQNAAEWGKTLGEFVQLIIDGIEILIEEYDTSGMRDAIMTFLKNSKLGDLVSEVIKLKIKVWAEEMIIEASMAIPQFLSFVGESFKTVLAFLGGLLLTLATFIFGWAAGLGVKLSEWLAGLCNKILEWGDGSLIGVLSRIYVIIIKWGAGLFSAIARKLGEWLAGLCNKILEWGDGSLIGVISRIYAIITKWCTGLFGILARKLGADLGQLIDALWNILRKGWNSITEWFRKLTLPSFKLSTFIDGGNLFNIPQLAGGGIVRQSTIANIGEAGKEAVIPLENNTGWMDTLAAKVAGQIGNGAGTNGNPVIIDMSKATKQVYTRSEMLAFGREVAESLKLAGFVVSVNV